MINLPGRDADMSTKTLFCKLVTDREIVLIEHDHRIMPGS